MEDFTVEPPAATTGMAKAVYILYIAGIVIGITGIIGVIIAYVNKGEAPQWLQSHYRFQIRTFWIGAIYLIVGTLLSFFLIGYLILLFWVIWLVVRCIKGFRKLDQQLPHPQPTSWWL